MELQKEIGLRKDMELKLKQTETQRFGNVRTFFQIPKPDREVLEMRHNAIFNNIISHLHGTQSSIVCEALRSGFFLRRDYTSLANAFYWLTGLHKEPIDWHEFHEWLYAVLIFKYYV